MHRGEGERSAKRERCIEGKGRDPLREREMHRGEGERSAKRERCIEGKGRNPLRERDA